MQKHISKPCQKFSCKDKIQKMFVLHLNNIAKIDSSMSDKCLIMLYFPLFAMARMKYNMKYIKYWVKEVKHTVIHSFS